MSRWLLLLPLLFVTFFAGLPARAHNAATAQQLFTELSATTPVKALRGQRVVIAGPKAADPTSAGQVAAAADLREALQTTVINSGFFRVVEREELDRILKELKIDMSDLGDPANARKVGKLLGADLIVLGAVTTAGDTQRVSVRLVRISTAEAIRAAAMPLGATTNPDTAPAPDSRAVLLVSSDGRLKEIVKEAGLACRAVSVLPTNLKPYTAVWLADKASVKSGTAEQLRRYVEDGGRLLTNSDVPLAMMGANAAGYLTRSWLGLGCISPSERDTWSFPDHVLGVETPGQAHWYGKKPYCAQVIGVSNGGNGLVTNGYSMFVYTFTTARGRFFYQGELDDPDHSPVLRQCLIAGLKWLTAAE